MTNLIKVISKQKFANEAEVEAHAGHVMKAAGYKIKLRKSGNSKLDKHWPSKAPKGDRPRKGTVGAPDMLLFIEGSDKPVCVWDNKEPKESAQTGLADAKFYIEGLRKALPNEPSLPRIAAGFNGAELVLSYFNNDGRWIHVKQDGNELRDCFPGPDFVRNGISSVGAFNAARGAASAADLRALLPKLKTLYRVIPPLASGRTPIDFTVAILTLRLLVEQNPDWGSWAEQPMFAPGAKSRDHAIRERLTVIAKRVMNDGELKKRYGDIFAFKEKSDTSEIAFSFTEVIESVPVARGHFDTLFDLVDSLPPLQGADFDIFGEVYQCIGDEATKKALGEYFTGRHIISGVLPVLFARAGYDATFAKLQHKKISDVACGTGGFLTEALRLVKRVHKLDEKKLKRFACDAFFGYDLGHANASRARVNMYFAGDGFSFIEGGIDTLSDGALPQMPKAGFDLIMTNPPYGKSSYGRAEEAFLKRVVTLLKKGEGWGLIVLPTGVLENPRSAPARFEFLKHAAVTDVIALPKHAFAPYTQQRTAIAIFQRRGRPLAVSDNDWNGLIKHIGHEKVGLFIVDNDGFANSDKRYPTARRTGNGDWLHNDLAPWTDSKGYGHDSKAVQALIHGKKPSKSEDEFGNSLGNKYAVLRLSALFDKERGIALLPDIFLRTEDGAVELSDYLKRGNRLIKFRSSNKVKLPNSFYSELDELLSRAVKYAAGTATARCKVTDLFDIERGATGLTEQIIYQNFDKVSGIPVYGGGASKPKFKIAKNTITNQHKKIDVFCAPAIVASMDGTAGAMKVIEAGEFCSNHHGRVLKQKAGQKIDLYWFVQQAEQGLKALASNKGGSATLTAPHLEQFVVLKPKSAAVMKKIGSMRRALVKIKEEFEG